MTPNNLRMANLLASMSTEAQRPKRYDPVQAAYSQLPPVDPSHSFTDYANFVGLKNPTSIMLSPEEKILRDAINRKFAVARGAPQHDPNARYMNFDNMTDVLPNAVAATGNSILDGIAGAAGAVSDVTPLAGNLRDWAESGDLRRTLNEMYQRSLGNLDREKQITPSGQQELQSRDALASFLGQTVMSGGLGAASKVAGAASKLPAMAGEGIDAIRAMFSGENLANAARVEGLANTQLLNDFKGIGNAASDIATLAGKTSTYTTRAGLNYLDAMRNGEISRDMTMPAIDATSDLSWLPKRPVGFRVDEPNIKIPATPEFKPMEFPKPEFHNFGLSQATMNHGKMPTPKIADSSVENIIAKMMPDFRSNAAIKAQADTKNLAAQIGEAGRSKLDVLLKNKQVVDDNGRPFGALIKTPQTLLTSEDIRKVARNTGQTADIVREFLKKHIYPN